MWKYGMINISKEMEEMCMKIYKVYYRTVNEMEKYTFIEADSKEMIESVLYHVQGMTTELIRYEEVTK